MKIKDILINHMVKPIGFDLSNLRVQFKLDGVYKANIEKQLIIENKNEIVYQTKWSPFPNNYFDVDFKLAPTTRYIVTVAVRDGDEVITAESFFETGRMSESLIGKWISSPISYPNTIFDKEFKIDQEVDNGRLYITGLGLYEAYIDGNKIGDEYLTPGVTAYDQWTQIQTYDVTSMMTSGTHRITVSVADGWYKGNYGFDGGKINIYGDRQMIIGELDYKVKNGPNKQIATDDTWKVASGKITNSAIYYGEDLDDTIEIHDWSSAVIVEKNQTTLSDRMSLPLKVKEELPVISVLSTPAGETVLDFGQNHAGWLSFYNTEPKGNKIKFEMGEILQSGNFYRDNLRNARAAFTYVSDGNKKWVRPHFTYFGYRYVKVSGNLGKIDAKNFKSLVMYSDMSMTGNIETDNSKVNRLFRNIQWGQKSNFFDVPTDCPQRDERLGWTGDANIFSNTASFNMDVFQFFKKYSRDMLLEQKTHNGKLTMYAPSMGEDDGGAAVWGDAATVIPWNMYLNYGDASILKQNFESMKSWVDWVTDHTKKANLWTECFQFGDWLALDGENPALPIGKTEEDFIASVYYYYSSVIVSRAATTLGRNTDAKHYKNQAIQIKKLIQDEYITRNGKVSIDTQTAYSLVLRFHLVPEDQMPRVTKDLVRRLDKDDNHLKTGFIGTPFINQVLTENGQHKLAVKLFLNEDYPSWLYAVNLGATTVWERWNSVLEDGSMNPQGMNSLNHYSIGAVMEWAYRYMLGITDHDAGYTNVTLSPKFDYRLKHVKGNYDSVYGKISIEYQIESDSKHTIIMSLDVPNGQKVRLKLPRTDNAEVNGKLVNNPILLHAGHFDINYIPTEDYIEKYSLNTPVAKIMADKQLVNNLKQVSEQISFFENQGIINNMGKMNIPKINEVLPAININESEMNAIEKTLISTPLMSERNENK